MVGVGIALPVLLGNAEAIRRAVRGVDPETGFSWDDTKRYLDAVDLPAAEKGKIFELNALRVYPRLAQRLA